MTDYTAYIGGSTTLMIRDTGGWVEFWIQTGSSTWNNDQQYSFGANGGGSGIRTFRMVRGGGWQYVDRVFISYDQDISFTIYGSGLGFPTYSFFQHIQRTTVPQPPTLRGVDAISDTTVHIYFTGNYDGGSPVEEWQIGFGSNPDWPEGTVGSDGEDDVGGFYSGQRVYFWARGRNALGWSGWSNRGETVTWQVPPDPGDPDITELTQTSVGVEFPFPWRDTDPGNLEGQIRYGQDPTAAVLEGTVEAGYYPSYFTDLDPGGTYYFWARARNAVGWGPWTSAKQVMLIAGARVLDSGQWVRAVPYVNVGGVWKVAKPWVKNQGVWTETAI
jgi:hypothetical protein